MKRDNFDAAYLMARQCISAEFNRHERMLSLDLFSEKEIETYKRIQNEADDIELFKGSVKFLCQCLEKAYGEKVIVLLDEYDVPLENAHFQGFYEDMISFIRGMLSMALKTNDFLAFAVITGCLRISKESIFTGLNNLKIVSIENKTYGEYFGFTNEEVEEMLRYYGKESHIEQVKDWYNGYLFGETEVYNPWSVISHMDDIMAYDEELPKPYWSNTSSNSIIKDLLEKASVQTKRELEGLIQGVTIKKPIHEDITYEDIYASSDNLWNFLYFTGYLKKVSERSEGRGIYLTMEIPNEEIKYIYERQIMEWAREKIEQRNLTALHEAVLSGDVETIEEEINQALMETISYHDYSESYYHGFIGGMLMGIEGYSVNSNMELGLGRPDLVLEPTNINKISIILEFKVTREGAKLKQSTEDALTQIKEKQYEEGYHALGYENTIAYGVVVYGNQTIPIHHSTVIATITTRAEMINPCSIGANPALFISLKFVFRPIEANAATIMNLLPSLAISEMPSGIIPKLFTIASPTKPTMNHGKMDKKLILLVAFSRPLRVRFLGLLPFILSN